MNNYLPPCDHDECGLMECTKPSERLRQYVKASDLLRFATTNREAIDADILAVCDDAEAWQELVNAAEREFPDLDTITTNPSNKLLVETVRRWVQMFHSVAEKLSGCESIISIMTDQLNYQKQRIAELESKATTR